MLQTRRAIRAKRARTIQHLFAAILLILAGYERVRGPGAVLPILEVAAGVLLIGSVVFERVLHHHVKGVAWVEFAGAAMTLVEAFARLEERHHVSFYVLSFITPVLLFALAIFDAQITPQLRSDDAHLKIRFRALFRRRIAWSDIESWAREDDRIEVRMRSGQVRKLDFRDVINRDEAIAWTERQLSAHVLPGRDRRAGEREQDDELVPREQRPE